MVVLGVVASLSLSTTHEHSRRALCSVVNLVRRAERDASDRYTSDTVAKHRRRLGRKQLGNKIDYSERRDVLLQHLPRSV